MKNYAKVLVFAAIVALIVVPAHAAGNDGLCKLIIEMERVFKILRVLAFLGAGFYMADWAWGYISSGKVEMKDIKGKGVGLLTGFALLFIIGIVLSALLSAAGKGGSLQCETQIINFGK